MYSIYILPSPNGQIDLGDRGGIGIVGIVGIVGIYSKEGR